MTEQSTRVAPPVPNSPVDLRLLGNESHLGSTCTVFMLVPGRRGRGSRTEFDITCPEVSPSSGRTDRQAQKGTSPSERRRATGKPFN